MLTPFQKRKLTRYFNCLDVDGNGYFEYADIKLIARRLAEARNFGIGSEEHMAIQSGLDLIWDNARMYGLSQNPSQVSLADWLFHETVILASDEMREGYMKKITRDVFDLVDADGNGTIEIEEYTQLMKAFGVEDGIPEWAFKKLDLDGNGVIDKEEFVILVEQFHLSEDRNAPGNYLFGPY